MAKKRKTAAQKQRTHARQQHQHRVASDGAPTAAPQAAPRAKRPPQRRSAAGSRRSSSGRFSWVAIGGVVAVIGLMVVLFVTRKGPSQEQSDASAAAIAKVTNVPASALTTVGAPSDVSWVHKLPAGVPAVQDGSKPVVTYVGAEYCPYCAAERWPFVVALSRFGTFSNLGTTTSSASDAYPNTATLSFHGSSYTSDYISLSAVETDLDTPTAQQQLLISTYDTPPYIGGSNGGSIPFVMIGNLYAWAGASYLPVPLQGKTFDQIASALSDPTSAIAKPIDGAANQIAAMICQLTGGQPPDVCSAPYIQQAQAALPSQ